MGRIRTIAVLGALLFASTASAQTTDCRQKPNGGIECSAASGATIRPEDVSAKRCSPIESALSGSDSSICRARAIAADRKSVTDMIADGRCDDAVRAALRLGDLKFAADVREYCRREAKP